MEVGKIHCKYNKLDPCSQQSLLVLAKHYKPLLFVCAEICKFIFTF